jgi:hypothetical protein
MTTFGELCCEVCGVSGQVTTMHRSGPKGKGIDPHWRCESCLGPADPVALAVTDDFQTHNMALRDDDLAPMSPEMIAWVRGQRAAGRPTRRDTMSAFYDRPICPRCKGFGCKPGDRANQPMGYCPDCRGSGRVPITTGSPDLPEGTDNS